MRIVYRTKFTSVFPPPAPVVDYVLTSFRMRTRTHRRRRRHPAATINPLCRGNVRQPRAHQISSSTTKSSEEYQCIECARDGSLFASIVTSSSSALCENDEDESGGQNTSNTNKANKTSKTNVVLFDGETNAEVTRISEQFVQGASCVAFSNTGKFLSICSKANHTPGGQGEELIRLGNSERKRTEEVFEVFPEDVREARVAVFAVFEGR